MRTTFPSDPGPLDLKGGLALIGLGAVWLGAFYVADRLDISLGLQGWLFWLSMVFVSWLVCQMFGAISGGDPSELWKLTGLLKVYGVLLLMFTYFGTWKLLADTIGGGWASLVMVAGSVLVVWLFSSVMLALEQRQSGNEQVDGDRDVQEWPDVQTDLCNDDPDDES